MKYLSSEQVLFIRSRLIDTTGGAHGIRDVCLLRAAVSRPQATFKGKDLYPDLFFRMAAALMESLSMNHPFLDGNKRTAITSAAIFLGMNGYRLETTQKELERVTRSLAMEKVPFDTIVSWSRKHAIERQGS